jgi:hypothetical protein
MLPKYTLLMSNEFYNLILISQNHEMRVRYSLEIMLFELSFITNENISS